MLKSYDDAQRALDKAQKIAVENPTCGNVRRWGFASGFRLRIALLIREKYGAHLCDLPEKYRHIKVEVGA